MNDTDKNDLHTEYKSDQNEIKEQMNASQHPNPKFEI